MTAEVIDFPGVSLLDIPPDRILNAAVGKLDQVLILGFTTEGKEYFASSKSDASEAIFLCERAKHRLMKLIDEMSDDA